MFHARAHRPLGVGGFLPLKLQAEQPGAIAPYTFYTDASSKRNFTLKQRCLIRKLYNFAVRPYNRWEKQSAAGFPLRMRQLRRGARGYAAFTPYSRQQPKMYQILLIDDNRDILEANRSYFTEQGFDAVPCLSGKEALSRLGEKPFDCIVLDVMMPGMDGYAVCAAIRKRSDTPLIFLSCLDQPDEKVRGLMLGGDAYMTKPYDLRELHAQVLACIRRGQCRSLSYKEDFVLDRELRMVRLYAHSVVLSKKEWALLKLLMDKQGETLYKEKLLGAIWPGEAPEESRLHSLVRNLRRKLDFAEDRLGRIEAVYGEGYRLTVQGGERI